MEMQNTHNVVHTTEDVIHLSSAIDPIVELLQKCALPPSPPLPPLSPVQSLLVVNSATTQTVGDVSNMILRHHPSGGEILGLHVNWTNIGCIFAGVTLKATFDIYCHYKTAKKICWKFILKCVTSVPVVGSIVSTADVLVHNSLSALAVQVGKHTTGWGVASTVLGGLSGLYIGRELGGAIGKTYSTWQGRDKEIIKKDTKTGQIVGAVILGGVAVLTTALCPPVGIVWVSLAVSIAIAKEASKLWDSIWGYDHDHE
jgi:hypothetical protein